MKEHHCITKRFISWYTLINEAVEISISTYELFLSAYRKRYGSSERRRRIKNRVSIDGRQDVVERRNRIGDWEGDTVIAKGGKGALLTLIKRKPYIR